MYSNRETMLCDAQLSTGSSTHQNNQHNDSVTYYNFAAIENEITRIQAVERSQSVRIPNNTEQTNGFVSHTRAHSLVEMKPTIGNTRKIPENLKLSECFVLDNSEPSPALSTSSGPYIPISECFSGSPGMLSNPATPLNSLDPKFYDTPRSHINMSGLNLTNDQPYSPKRNNCPPVKKYEILLSGTCRGSIILNFFFSSFSHSHGLEVDDPVPQTLNPYLLMTKIGQHINHHKGL